MKKAQTLVRLQFILFASIAGSALLISTDKAPSQWAIGGSLALLGLLIGVQSMMEHRRINRRSPNASPMPNDEAHLVTSGLYRYVRHPIYTGVLLIAFGITVWHGHMVTLTANILLVGLLTYKSLYEEELLRAQYPQYHEYMQSTGRFLPKIF